MLRFLLLLTVLFAVAKPQPKHSVLNRLMLGGRPPHGLLPEPDSDEKSTLATTAGTIAQPLDHFSTTGVALRQRYWYNNEYYKSGGPVFLMLGGEGAASTWWIANARLPFDKMAKDHGAMMFLLEHRYYGESQPQDETTSNLKYLSSRQALEDTAEFIKKMNAEHNLDGAKWITFGGSYSGALSGWMRLKHPELVYAAVATSGPVLAEVDFYQYNEVVQTALTEQSKKCADNVHAGFIKMQELMKTTAGKKELDRIFTTCSSLTGYSDRSIEIFYSIIINNYKRVVQYSGDNVGEYRTRLTVAKICSFHEDDNIEPIEQMGKLNNYLMPLFGEQCTFANDQALINEVKEGMTSNAYSASTSWFWQTCTEFGYYQTTDSPTAGEFFGHVRSLQIDIDDCRASFGSHFTMNNDTIFAAIDATNKFYGGLNYKSSRVVFPNGSWDPWHALGILTSKHPDYTAVFMKGTSHCANMYPAASDDLASLKTGRETIELNVATWVNA